MTGIQHALSSVFHQLNYLLLHLHSDVYKAPNVVLMGATIGQHVRHTLEMMLCLQEGYRSGMVNYEKRKRDIYLETDIQRASDMLRNLESSLPAENKELHLEVGYDLQSDEVSVLKTNYYRELIYNAEHAIHHMAQIRSAVRETGTITLPESFGVASSTLKYRQQCAQ